MSINEVNMGYNNERLKIKPRDIIPVCTVHDKFQTVNGRWLKKSEDFDAHVIHTHSQEASLIESPCDECDNPKQLNLDL